MTSSTTTTKTSASACPYAVALHHDEETDNESATTTTTTEALGLSQCPAFSANSCPFKDCHDEDSVRKALLSIPKNHFEETNPQFLSVLQELHEIAGKQQQQTSSDPSSNKFQLTCPVASKVVDVVPHNAAVPPVVNFTQAMEGYSLAAIMAKMAEQMEQEEEEAQAQEEEQDNKAGDRAASFTETKQEKTTTVTESPKEENESKTTTTTITTTTTDHRRLSTAFKTGTAVSHQAAEDVHFVRNFIRGKIDRNVYAELVVQLYHVYNTLEQCLRESSSTSDAMLQQFQSFHQKLERTETLVEDLDYWHGPARTKEIVEENNNRDNSSSTSTSNSMSPAARDYVNRLRYCAETDPWLLLAHSYTRYLGDLSGGKILARVARRALGLGKKGEDGLAFYEFDQIASAKLFKDEYRAALDALEELTDAQITKLVNEANVAFLLNMRLFEELDVMANVPGARVRPLEEALAYADDSTHPTTQSENDGDDDDKAKSAECPFIVKKDKAVVVVTKTTKTALPDECPFANTSAATSQEEAGGGAAAAAVQSKKHGRCPWPFIILHDPVASLQDWQTWAVIGLVLCFAWSKFQQS